MLPAERRYVRQQIGWDADALSPQVLDGSLQINGVPVDDRRGDEAQARCAEALVLERAVADLALFVKEDSTAQRIACLALVEASMAAPPQVGIGQPLQGEQCALYSSHSAQRARERIARSCRRQLAQDDGGHRSARFDGCFQPDEFRPLVGDGRHIDGITDEWLQQRIHPRLFNRVELAIFQILDAWREAIAEEMAEAKDVIRRAGGVGIMFPDPQIRLVGMVVKTVENVRGFALRGGDDAGEERPEPTGHMGVEDAARIDAVFRVDVARARGMAARAEILAI